MSIVSLGSSLYLPPFPNAVASVPTFSSTNIRLNSATDYVGFIFEVGKAGTINDVGWFTRVVTTGCTVQVRLETVSTSTGLPTGTLVSAGASGTTAVADTDDNVWFTTTLGTPPTVTVGQLVAIVFKVSSGTPSNLQIGGFDDSGLFRQPSIIEFDGTASNITGISPIFSLHYSDTTCPPTVGVWPIKALNTDTYNSGSNPNTRGNRFQVPHSVRAVGAWIYMDTDSDAAINLYDSDGVTISATGSIWQSVPPLATPGLEYVAFTAPVTLAADTNYTLAVKPSSGTNLSVYSADVNAAGLLEAMPGGTRWFAATATNPTGTGSWTTTSTQFYLMGLVIDGVEAAGGGGGTTETAHVFAC